MSLNILTNKFFALEKDFEKLKKENNKLSTTVDTLEKQVAALVEYINRDIPKEIKQKKNNNQDNWSERYWDIMDRGV